MATYDHLRFRVDGVLQFLEIYRPFRGRRSPSRAILGRMERNIADGAAGHFNVANISDHRVSLSV